MSVVAAKKDKDSGKNERGGGVILTGLLVYGFLHFNSASKIATIMLGSLERIYKKHKSDQNIAYYYNSETMDHGDSLDWLHEPLI